MAERAAVLAPLEELLWEQDVTRRHALIDQRNTVGAGIDDALSKQIVVRRELHGTGPTTPGGSCGRGVRETVSRSRWCIDGPENVWLLATTTAPRYDRVAVTCNVARYRRTRGLRSRRDICSEGRA